MKRHLLLSAVLAALVAVLMGACGGDDNEDNDNAQTRIVTATTPGPTAPADRGATGTTGNQTKSGSKKKSEKAERREKAEKRESDLEAEALDPNATDAQDKISYAAAKQVCRDRKLEDLKSGYKPKGTSPKAIARAVSKGYMPKHRTKAAYAGCLAGLKQR